MQLIVTVRRLNRRSVIPYDFPEPNNIIGEVREGFVFEAEEVDEMLVPNPALGKWYRDRVNTYYWGGGLQVISSALERSTAAPQIQFSWWLKNANYSIPDLWDGQAGPQVTIAVLDTGINEHIDFDFQRIRGFNYLENTAVFKSDVNGHGTHLVGIMTAKGQKSFGLMPAAHLFIAKVCDNAGTPSLLAVKNALTDIKNRANGADRIDVINMSFNIIPKDSEEELFNEITSLLKAIANTNQCVLVAACGDEDWEFENFPASMDECISVGSIGANFIRSSFSTMSRTLDIMAPGNTIISSHKQDAVIQRSGTSQSAAMISALCALGVQELKKKQLVNYSVIRKSLFQTAINKSFPLVEYGHGIMNPNSFIQTLKSL